MSSIQDITDADFSSAIASGTVIVDIWAPWCGPCKVLTPMLEQLAPEFTDLTIVKLNADETALMGQYVIRSVPTLLKFKDGVEVSRKVGVTNLSDLRAFLEA